jgi:glycosyltransferase involved in cell wall biosynthesis
MSNKKKYLLLLADWHIGSTGFGTVMRNLLPHLKKRFDNITYVAINYIGEPYNEDNVLIVSAKNYYTPEVDGKPQEDLFGRHSFLHLLANNPFDTIFIFQDMDIISKMIPTLKELHQYKLANNITNFKSAVYFPVDGNIPKGRLDGWEFFNSLVVYNEYSRMQVLKNNPKLAISIGKKKLHIVNHGNNNHDFYQMPSADVIKFKSTFFGKNCEKWIVSAINRNQPRKDIGSTILGFIEARRILKESYPEIKQELFLYLHMMEADPYMNGYDLRKIFSQTDLVEGEDYKIADQEYFNRANGADIEIVRSIYNASNCFITTTLGGGWELTVTEAMACGCPVIAPYHTSLMEISGDGKRAWMLYELEPFCSPFDNIIRAKCNIEEVAEQIIAVLNDSIYDQDKYHKTINLAKNYANSLDWNILGDNIADIIDKI